MKLARILLRAAAVLMLIHLTGHTVGHSGWKKANDPVQAEVITQMTGPKFPFMGAKRSMGEFFDGYGIGCSIGMLLFILVLWNVSGYLKTAPKMSKSIILSVAICLLAWGIDEVIFFFPFAASITLIAFVCTMLAYIVVKVPGETQPYAQG